MVDGELARLTRAGLSPGHRLGGAPARGGRQARPPADRAPRGGVLRRRARRRRAMSPSSPSSCTWRRCCTTTSSTTARSAAGSPRSRRIWGNAVSVLAGDLLLDARAGADVAAAAPAAVLTDLFATLRRLVDGEIVQLRGRAPPRRRARRSTSASSSDKTGVALRVGRARRRRDGRGPAEAVDGARRLRRSASASPSSSSTTCSTTTAIRAPTGKALLGGPARGQAHPAAHPRARGRGRRCATTSTPCARRRRARPRARVAEAVRAARRLRRRPRPGARPRPSERSRALDAVPPCPARDLLAAIAGELASRRRLPPVG